MQTRNIQAKIKNENGTKELEQVRFEFLFERSISGGSPDNNQVVQRLVMSAWNFFFYFLCFTLKSTSTLYCLRWRQTSIISNNTRVVFGQQSHVYITILIIKTQFSTYYPIFPISDILWLPHDSYHWSFLWFYITLRYFQLCVAAGIRWLQVSICFLLSFNTKFDILVWFYSANTLLLIPF